MASDFSLGERPATMVNSSVLLDVLTEDVTWGQWSRHALARASNEGRLVSNPIVYAEVSIGFDQIEDLDNAVAVSDCEREPLLYEAGFLAARRLSNIADEVVNDDRRCQTFTSVLTAVRGYRLLTRNINRIHTLFPSLELLAP